MAELLMIGSFVRFSLYFPCRLRPKPQSATQRTVLEMRPIGVG